MLTQKLEVVYKVCSKFTYLPRSPRVSKKNITNQSSRVHFLFLQSESKAPILILQRQINKSHTKVKPTRINKSHLKHNKMHKQPNHACMSQTLTYISTHTNTNTHIRRTVFHSNRCAVWTSLELDKTGSGGISEH